MKIVTYSAQGRELLGVVQDSKVVDVLTLAQAAGIAATAFASMLDFLRGGDAALGTLRDLLGRKDAVANAATYPLDQAQLCAPIPNPSKIVAVGLNYREHCTEQGIKAPEEPLLFAKFPNSVTGPFDPIVIPEENPEVDYEVELGVVIGRRAKRVAEADAFNHIAGYLVLNDVSARKWQFADKQWTRGKSCDTFCPIGPWLTTTDEVPNPEALAVMTRVNGEVLQESSTANLIFGIAKLISYISASITLEPGDVIATGTPPGVGCFRNPPIYLKPGDHVEISVEGLGALNNPVVAEREWSHAVGR